jgi:hypothetical protein
VAEGEPGRKAPFRFERSGKAATPTVVRRQVTRAWTRPPPTLDTEVQG